MMRPNDRHRQGHADGEWPRCTPRLGTSFSLDDDDVDDDDLDDEDEFEDDNKDDEDDDDEDDDGDEEEPETWQVQIQANDAAPAIMPILA